jgi:hypothetical protein
MTLNELKREILLHADILAPGEAMTAEQGALTLHQTVGRALAQYSSANPPSAWLAGQIAYCLAQYIEEQS